MSFFTKLLNRLSKSNNNTTNPQCETTNIRKAYIPPSLNDPHAFGNTNGGRTSYYYKKYYPESCKADNSTTAATLNTTPVKGSTTVRDNIEAKSDRQPAHVYYNSQPTEKLDCDENDVQKTKEQAEAVDCQPNDVTTIEKAGEFDCDENDVQKIRERAEAIGCQLNDVTTIEKVREFESKHGVTLPEDYVWFITSVGDGGTWRSDGEYPFYPLEKTGFSYEGLPNYKKGEEKFSLDVLSKGCSYSYGIVLKGENFGKISSNGDELAFYRPAPINSFKEFYLTWLNETYAGYTDDNILSRIPGRIEKLLEEYRNNHSYDYAISIFNKATPQSVSPQLASDLYSVFINEPAGENKMFLAKTLFKIRYSNIPAVIKNIYQPENYGDIIWCIHSLLNYFEGPGWYENVMRGAALYYPTLLEILKYFYNALPEQEIPDFDKLGFSELDYEKCFNMVVMNPRFKPNDILELLTSDKPFIIEHLAFNYYDRGFLKNIKDRIHTYVDTAKVKYDQQRNSN